MSDHRHFTDEELTAFLDGENEHAPIGEIEAQLRVDANLRARLDALRLNSGDITEAFNTLLPNAPQAPEFLQEGFKTESAGRKPWRVAGYAAAAALLAGFVGFAGGSYWSSQKPAPGWIDVVADYQALYVNGTLAAIDRPPEEARSELDRVAGSFGKDLSFEALTANDQLDFKRAQLLGFNGKPLVQLAYLSDAGDPVALCIIKSGKPGDAAVITKSLKGMRTAIWRKNGYAYVLIGGKDAGLIERAAEVFSKVL